MLDILSVIVTFVLAPLFITYGVYGVLNYYGKI